ncbi:hypothetical protein Z043_108965 [Scleropages formosus]|uniref:Uncharacterized protein n=1 Tax=Scleropages formosus TaxID=113540 RepID=A0A0N8K0G4_SCLFO|nr:hypothetical protein Z043_108965 [Scleropages formosus]
MAKFEYVEEASWRFPQQRGGIRCGKGLVFHVGNSEGSRPASACGGDRGYAGGLAEAQCHPTALPATMSSKARFPPRGDNEAEANKLFRDLEVGTVLTLFYSKKSQRPERRTFQVKLETRQVIWTRGTDKVEGGRSMMQSRSELRMQQVMGNKRCRRLPLLRRGGIEIEPFSFLPPRVVRTFRPPLASSGRNREHPEKLTL